MFESSVNSYGSEIWLAVFFAMGEFESSVISQVQQRYIFPLESVEFERVVHYAFLSLNELNK